MRSSPVSYIKISIILYTNIWAFVLPAAGKFAGRFPDVNIIAKLPVTGKKKDDLCDIMKYKLSRRCPIGMRAVRKMRFVLEVVSYGSK